MKRSLTAFFFSFALAALHVLPAHAGYFANIVIDDDYSDWVGVPVVDSDAGDNTGGPDIGDTQIANDANYLYIRNTFPNSLALGTFLSIDIDKDASTGFDIFGLGLVGVESGWQNDFPFTSANGVFNDGNGMTGDFFGSGAALLAPFGDVGSRELAIPLNITRNVDGSLFFPDDTIRLMLWTDKGLGTDGFGGFDGDVSAVIDYQLAVPEPTTLAIGCLIAASAAIRRRRQR